MRAYERGERPGKAYSLESVNAYITYLTEHDAVLPLEGLADEFGSTRLMSRGAGAPSALQFQWTLKSTESSLNLVSNAGAPSICARLKKMRKQWVSEGAKPFDVVQARAARACACCALASHAQP